MHPLNRSRRNFLGAATAGSLVGQGAVVAPAMTPPLRPTFRDRLLECLGGPWPEPCPLDPRPRAAVEHDGWRIESIQKDGYRIELIDYQVEPGVGHALSPAMWSRTRDWFERHLQPNL